VEDDAYSASSVVAADPVLLSSDDDADDANIYVPARRILQRAAPNTNAKETTNANIINAVDSFPPTAPDQTSVSPAPVMLWAGPGADDAKLVASATSE